MKIAFWNINKKSFLDDISDFIYLKDIDIAILSECTLSANKIISKLKKSHSQKNFYSVNTPNGKFRILTRLDKKCIKNFDKMYGGESWSINRFDIPAMMRFSIVSVHLPSKLHWDDESQTLEAINMMRQVQEYEQAHGYNTILIGDFNMNPYETGMTSSIGLHGIKDATIVKDKKRKVLGKLYTYLYNPMWNYLGDHNDVPGTYYYRKSVHNNVMWNTFDQVLVRPDLLDHFGSDDVEIVTQIGTNYLVNPRTKQINNLFSDHLPITLNLKM